MSMTIRLGFAKPQAYHEQFGMLREKRSYTEMLKLLGTPNVYEIDGLAWHLGFDIESKLHSLFHAHVVISNDFGPVELSTPDKKIKWQLSSPTELTGKRKTEVVNHIETLLFKLEHQKNKGALRNVDSVMETVEMSPSDIDFLAKAC